MEAFEVKQAMKRLGQAAGKVKRGEDQHGAEIWQCLHYLCAKSQAICATARMEAQHHPVYRFLTKILT